MVELTHKRNWDSKVFDTGRFEKERPIYGTKLQNGLHDIEPNGSYVECNPSMRDYVGNVSTLEAIRGRYGSLRAGDTESESKDRVKIITKRDCGISLKLCGHKTYGPWDDTTRKIRFDTDDGITLNYYPSYKGVNIVITVDNPQTSSNVITFSLKEYGCDYTYEENNGNIIARSSTGEDDIYINALYAVDANETSGHVSFRLGNIVDGYQRIEKVIEPIWFGNAIGPVEIDPSVTIDDASGTLLDNMMIDGTNSEKNYGQNVENQVEDNRSFMMQVDLTAYSGITIISSKFGLDIFVYPGDMNISWYRILRAWIEGTVNGAIEGGSPCWDYSNYSSVAWTTGGCKGAGTDRYTTAEGTSDVIGIDSDYPLDMTNATTQGWTDNSSNNNGIVVERNTGATSKVAARSSQTTLGNKPYFYMEYTEAVDGGGIQGIFGLGRLGIR